MRKTLTALATAATIAIATVATPTTADARWGWRGGAFFGGLAAARALRFFITCGHDKPCITFLYVASLCALRLMVMRSTPAWTSRLKRAGVSALPLVTISTIWCGAANDLNSAMR